MVYCDQLDVWMSALNACLHVSDEDRFYSTTSKAFHCAVKFTITPTQQKHNRQEITAFYFAPLGLFLYLLPSLFFFPSFIILFSCACNLAVDSNVCCAARCTCPLLLLFLLLLFLHPFLFLTSISFHAGELDYVWSCDRGIWSTEFKAIVHSKMKFCHLLHPELTFFQATQN